MANSYLINPRLQFFKSNGDLAAGWYVYIYNAGTTDPATIYGTVADADAATNPIDNPQILDSRGETTIVPASAIKIALYDAAIGSGGNLIWSKDYVNSSSGDLVDSNGNLVLKFVAAAASVNYFQMTNAATGDKPTGTVAGTDTNITRRETSKGTGAFEIESGSSGIKLNTTNNGAVTTGTGLFTAGGAATVTGALTASSTLGVTGTSTLGVVNAGVITGTSFNTITGVATQTEQEAGSSAVKAVTPSVAQYHPSAAKCWGYCGVAGNLIASYNITSITDTGTGIVDVTIATDFSSAGFSALATTLVAASPVSYLAKLQARAAGAITIYSVRTSDGVPTDPDSYSWACYGDQ